MSARTEPVDQVLAMHPFQLLDLVVVPAITGLEL